MTSNDTFLRRAIRADATGTALLGVAAAAFARPLSTLTGLTVFNVVGTAAAVALVASGLLPLTGAGKAIVLGCGVYTLFFGILQWVGVRRTA